MKCSEFKNEMNRQVEELNGKTMPEHYRKRIDYFHIDMVYAAEEGYINLSGSDISAYDHKAKKFVVKLDDGNAVVSLVNDSIKVMVNERPKHPKKYAARPSHYERTKAAVYATGNRWAIENFNATH